MTELTRFFATEGIILPKAAAACLSTPMGEDEIAFVANAFDRFLIQRAALLDTITG